jgi:hypothetical protein
MAQLAKQRVIAELHVTNGEARIWQFIEYMEGQNTYAIVLNSEIATTINANPSSIRALASATAREPWKVHSCTVNDISANRF